MTKRDDMTLGDFEARASVGREGGEMYAVRYTFSRDLYEAPGDTADFLACEEGPFVLTALVGDTFQAVRLYRSFEKAREFALDALRHAETFEHARYLQKHTGGTPWPEANYRVAIERWQVVASAPVTVDDMTEEGWWSPGQEDLPKV